MGKVQLREVALARSGDKGNTVNIGLFASTREWYEAVVREVTAERVKQHFHGLVEGEVERYVMPNIHAVNFVLRGALAGGGSTSIRMDNLGKCFGANLLRLEIEVEEAAVR